MPDGAHPTPSAPLQDGEEILQSFRPDRRTYLRDMAWLSAGAMAAGMAILWLIGNPHVWTGAVGGLAAIALRGWYLGSEELAVRWDLSERRLLGPGGRVAWLAEIVKINRMASAVQVITAAGDKYLIKYQADRDATAGQIRNAVRAAGGNPA
ncbi:hypothetical protein [Pseudoruegeria sp. HB172150]|uniref:hypothetical protein n=1 Tax=Pseudoruegeria sp. HB172150 TaxID=2721164 RepID=UPI0015573AB8|nr:hypothetical protein [Pseudoruegeria sp. HB172150]